MQAAPYRNPYNQQAVAPSAVAEFMGSAYRWMAIGLVITGVVAAYTASAVTADAGLRHLIFGTPLFYALLIGEFVMVAVFSSSVTKVSFGTAAAMFISYCALSGITFSVIFLAYQLTSIALAFYVTGGMFAAMSAYGTLTKRDLSSWGSLLFMGLIGVIIASVINMFFQSGPLDYVISFVSVVVFTGLTAYDTQKLRALANVGDKRLALAGALTLYLDFVNLFLALLRIFGRRR